jgi:predicted phage-related endonuclease
VKSQLLITRRSYTERRSFIGGSDARIIMGDDEATLVRLWREKRREVEPEDRSDNLIVQLGLAIEELNRRWYEANTGQVITDMQRDFRCCFVLKRTPDPPPFSSRNSIPAAYDPIGIINLP